MKRPKRQKQLDDLGGSILELERAVREARRRCQANMLLRNTWLDEFLDELARRLHPLAWQVAAVEANLQISDTS